uniref:Uncharacterized protein n=1 Tax=Anguilla anguilla TaxID=7936 RepID=A0A0E9PE35_ANGAN
MYSDGRKLTWNTCASYTIKPSALNVIIIYKVIANWFLSVILRNATVCVR